MGRIRDFFTGTTPVTNAAVSGEKFVPRFAVDAGSMPAQVFGLTDYKSAIAPEPRVSRREAMQLPAVSSARRLICASLGGLPLDVIDTERITHVNDLLEQPEKGVPRSVTMTWTVEDLVFEGCAYWRVTDREWAPEGSLGYPRWVKRIAPSRVDINEDTGQIRIDGKLLSDPRDLIQFQSPNDPLLIVGSRAIRTALRLDSAASRYADEPMPQGYLKETQDALEQAADDEELDPAQAVIDTWHEARKRNVTGYLPYGFDYQTVQWSPEQLQLADARQHAVLEIARLCGIDPEDLGVSTTSRTYENGLTRRQWFIDMTLGPYAHAIEDRLSLGDITKRGYQVRFDFDGFMRNDALTRFQAYEIGLRVGAIDKPEIRAMENKPAILNAPEPSPVLPSVAETAPGSSTPTFSEEDTKPIAFSAETDANVKVNTETRTIKGLALPYGVVGISQGRPLQFSQGSFAFDDRVKVLIGHDWKQAVGRVTEFQDSPTGLSATLKIANGPEGDRALQLAADGVLDGLSIGFHPQKPFTYETRNDVMHVTSGHLAEISLTPIPAFGEARITSVAASAVEPKEKEMTDTTSEPVVEPVTMSAVTDAIKAGFEALKTEGPTLVTPVAPTFEVTEEALYRFDGVGGKHDFSTDLIGGLKGDTEAYARVMGFINDAFTPQFAVSTGNVTNLNPVRQRPDMYVDERRFRTPLYDALNKGVLSDITPFVFPRFNSASGLVADHVEGVEPTPGAFSATSQTVTPSAMSGKVQITREVWDQGGNPQVSGLIFSKMVAHYYTAIEAKAYALLNGLTLPSQEVTITTGLTDDDLVNAVENAIVDLNFVAGGNTFDYAATHANLYRGLSQAVDSTGRKLLPQYGATNANGQSRSKFVSLDVAGTEFMPVPSLGAASTANGNSYLIDTSSVHVWNSAPQRLEFQNQVAFIELGIWGYVASAVSDLNGVRRLKYDPVA